MVCACPCALQRDLIYTHNAKVKILEQGKKVRVFLRKGVFFHNDFGEMTANDVVFSLNRIQPIIVIFIS